MASDPCLPNSLSPGLCTSSYAIHCASKFGIKPSILRRADKVSRVFERFEIVELLDPEMTDEEIAEYEEAERIAKKFLEWELEDVLSEWDDEREDETEDPEGVRQLLGKLEEILRINEVDEESDNNVPS